MMRRIVDTWAVIALAGVIAVVIAGLIVWSYGFGSRAQPSSLESSVAMQVHDSSIPDRYEKMSSPLATHNVDFIEAGGHYEKHCAVCHADNGSGETKFQGIMYPRPTNLLSQDTQEMSDGELYYVIKNGIRWSGMPAFGKPGDDDVQIWTIVAYVRHLPKLTPEEKQQVLHQAAEPIDHGDSAQEHAHGD